MAVRSAAVYAAVWMLAVGFAAIAGFVMARSDGTSVVDLTLGLLVGLVVFGSVALVTLVAAHVLWLVSVRQAIEPATVGVGRELVAVVLTGAATLGGLYAVLTGAPAAFVAAMAVLVLAVVPAALGWWLATSATPRAER